MNWIHVQLLIELKALLLVFYVCLWYGINKVFTYINQDKEVRLDLMTAFFYCTIPPMMISIIIYQLCIGHYSYWPVHIHLLLANTGYYVFSIMEECKVRAQRPWAIIAHHIAFGSLFFALSIYVEYGVIWSWLIIFQLSAVFFTIAKVIKHLIPSNYASAKPLLKIADFWFFLSFRMILQTGVMIYLVVQVWTKYPESYVSNSLITLTAIFSFMLNLNWFIQIAKQYQANRVKLIGKLQLAE